MKHKTMLFRRAVSIFLCAALLVTALPLIQPAGQVFAATHGKGEIEGIIHGIIDWKKADNGTASGGDLINQAYLELAGTTPGDWYQIGMARFGYKDNYAGYLAVIKEEVQNRYKRPEKLSAAKATEWHRISLAILACGGDPTNFGKDQNGEPINLIADGTYNRGKTTSLGRQGINGWIWGLITLDAKRYEIPEGASYTRGVIIVQILKQQLTDGGFALSGKTSDPDITAMALQALAPYYSSSHAYTYTQAVTGQSTSKTVKQVVDEALNWLSEVQLPTGDYKSWGTQNVESTDQVLVALCCLGINPQTDSRFIKNGNTLLDGILQYRMPDGGFQHSKTYDPENPTSLPDKSNTMAGEQTLYSLVALWRQMNGMRSLYDFRDVKSGAAGAAEAAGMKDETAEDKASEDAEEVTEGAGDDTTAVLPFQDADRKKIEALPERLTTEQYVDVITLIASLENSTPFQDKEALLKKLTTAKDEILAIQAEIDSLNTDIASQLYPFEHITLKDYGKVHKIVDRYHQLSAYDQKKILRWEDVIKTKTQVDNLARAAGIAVLLGSAAVFAAVKAYRRIQIRKNKKALEMQELENRYKDDETR